METGETSETGLIVIGGGITGLAAAWSASQSGTDTVLLEKSQRFGGSVVTHREGDYRVEGGPRTLMINEPELEDFLREAGLWERMIETAPAAKKRFVVKEGVPVALPTSLGTFVSGSFLSVPAKVRLLLEPLFHGRQPEGEEAIGPWMERHFGRQVREQLADPFVSGIYAGDPDRISLQSAFPALAETADLHPSIVRALMKRKKQMKEAGQVRYPRKMVSFEEGLGEMVNHLVRKGKFKSTAGVRLESIDRDQKQWRVRYRSGANAEMNTIRSEALLIAVPSQALAELPFDGVIREKLAVMKSVETPPVTTLSIAYKREQVKHPLDGFGLLSPGKAKREVLGILFDSSLFAGRAPADEVLLSAFVGGVRSPERARYDAETLLRLVKKECRELLGATGEPCYWKSTFWPQAIPQYNLGFREITGIFGEIEREQPQLTFAGNARDGVSLGACILSGTRRVRTLLS